MKNILGAQMRAARALLRWAAADLVRESGVSLATIHRAESVDGKTAMTFANASAIRRALENAGVELIEENGGAGSRGRLKQHLFGQYQARAFNVTQPQRKTSSLRPRLISGGWNIPSGCERYAFICLESIICVSVDRPLPASCRNRFSQMPRRAQRTN